MAKNKASDCGHSRVHRYRSNTDKRSQMSRYTTEKGRNTQNGWRSQRFCPHDNKMTIHKRSDLAAVISFH